jgi:hypothetical protein
METRIRRVWSAYLLIAVFLTWLIFLMTPLSDKLTRNLSRTLPGWIAMMIWSSCLLFIAVEMGPLALPTLLRVLSYTLFILSCLFLPVAFRTHPVGSIAVLILLYFEVHLFIPRWEAKWRRKQ